MTETQEPSVEAVKDAVPETVYVDDMGHFIELLVRWHDTKVRLLKHMEQIPDGTVIQFDDVEQAFTGDMRQGFMLGVRVALAELGELPFAAEVDDSEPAANDSADKPSH